VFGSSQSFRFLPAAHSSALSGSKIICLIVSTMAPVQENKQAARSAIKTNNVKRTASVRKVVVSQPSPSQVSTNIRFSQSYLLWGRVSFITHFNWILQTCHPSKLWIMVWIHQIV